MKNEKVLEQLIKLEETISDEMSEALSATGCIYLTLEDVISAKQKVQVAIDFGVDLGLLSGRGCYFELGHNRGCHGDRHIAKNVQISWEDDDKEPDAEEWLYIVGFSTGAYFLHSAYPQQTFKKMFAELKSFGPKYCDSANKILYFTKDSAKLLHKGYDAIIEKYRNMVKEELESKRIEELENELKKLKGE